MYLVHIHEQSVHLTPGGWGSTLSASRISTILRRLRPQEPVARQRREIVKELLAELRMRERKRQQISADLDTALESYGTVLTEIDGIGRVGAAIMISLAGDVTRFPTATHFASYAGTAPIAASSGDRVRYRLNRAANGRSTRCCTPEGTTIKTHVHGVPTKLDLRDRVQAVVYAYEHGLVQPGRQQYLRAPPTPYRAW